MAYKKYIKKNGKVYGPYVYHSKRVNGKVVTEYMGSKKREKNRKKILLLFFSLIVLAAILFLSFFKGFTGKVVVDFDSSFVGDNFTGNLKITLNKGELLPAESKVEIKNSDNYYEYSLNDLIDSEKNSGDFYLEGFDLSGNGDGFGELGFFEENVQVFFSVKIFEEIEIEDENGTINVIEEENIIQGDVSKDADFEYDLGGDFEYEIFDISSEAIFLNDSVLDVFVEDNTLFVSTDYSFKEEGFGEKYLEDDFVEYNIDFSKINLSLVEGDFSFNVYYLDDKIISYNTMISSLEEGEIENVSNDSSGVLDDEVNETDLNESFGEDLVNESFKNKTGVENVSNETFVLDDVNFSKEFVVGEMNLEVLSLSENEKQILRDNFGLVVVNTMVFDYRDKILVRFELGDYFLEGFYDSDLSSNDFNELVERDRIIWLKDLVLSFSSENYSYDKKEGMDSMYSIM